MRPYSAARRRRANVVTSTAGVVAGVVFFNVEIDEFRTIMDIACNCLAYRKYRTEIGGKTKAKGVDIHGKTRHG